MTSKKTLTNTDNQQAENSKSELKNSWTTSQVLYYFSFPVFCLLCFIFFVLWFTNGEISRNNYWSIQVESFSKIGHILFPWRDFFENLTQLGDAIILLPIISFFIVWKPQVWAGFFGAIPLGVLLSAGGKYLASVPRPGNVLDPALYPTVGSLQGYHSLPSGHTITVFIMIAVVVLLLIPVPRKKTHYSFLFCAFLLATFMSISRVAVGVHWPLDIIAGAALGFLAGVSGVILTQRYQRWWHWLNTDKYQYIFGTIMLIWSFSLFKEVYKHTDSSDIVIWIAAILGLITALYLLKRSFSYYRKNSETPEKN